MSALYYFGFLVLPSLLLLRIGGCIRNGMLAILGAVSFLLVLLVVEVMA